MRKYTFLSFLLVSCLVFMSATKDKATTIFVIGDSTAAKKDTTGGKVERGWAMMLQECFDADYIVVDNHAVNGRSSKSFINEGRWDKVLSLIKPGDYVSLRLNVILILGLPSITICQNMYVRHVRKEESLF